MAEQLERDDLLQGLEKLIDLLKTGGWQAFFVGASLFVFLRLQALGIIDTSSIPYVVPIVWLPAIIFSGIAAASLGDQIKIHFQTRKKGRAKILAEKARRQAFIDDIPRLSARERQIFGYLLENNRKRFDAASTGEYASGLIAKGYITLIARPGMLYSFSKFPFEVPDFVWDEMNLRKDQFPYISQSKGGGEKAPWIDSPW